MVNKVVNQESQDIDYDNPQKNYVYDAKAKLSIEDAMVKYNASSDDIKKVVEDLPAYDSKGESKKKAKKAKLAKADDEASKAERQKASDTAKTSSGTNSKKKRKGGSSGTNAKKSNKKHSDASNENDKLDENKIHYSQYGDLDGLPENVTSACAVGNAAMTVMSIAGKGYLTGCDSELYSNAQATKVFSSVGLSSAKVCWKNDGMSSGDIDVKAIIKLKPDAVLTVSGDNTVSKNDYAKLTSNGIEIIVLPEYNSDSNIKTAVKAVGKLFKKATDGASVKKASAYESSVDSILSEAKATHGGKVVTYGETDFNNTDQTTTRSDAMNPEYWTVYVSDWDSNATVTASFGKTLFTETGVAYTKVGWKWSPLSYYMGCGGVLNNAAAYGITKSVKGSRLFLTYNENQISYKWSDLDSSVVTGHNGGTFSGGGEVLSNGYDAAATGSENSIHYLGSSDFSTVVVKTSSIKKKLTAARSKNMGLYSLGTYQDGKTKGYGYTIGGKLLHSYTVAKNGDRGDVLYDIVVNPCGMAGSWTDGSMEACLESLWVANQYYGYSESKLKEKIKSFYSDYYGYSPSDKELEKILAGDYA